MKNFQKFLIVGVTAMSLFISIVGVSAASNSDDPSQDDTTQDLTRKVNEYEGQF